MSAAQSTINLYTTREAQEPQWWVEQAFIIAAGICLILELLNRADTDEEAHEYQSYVKRAIRFLQLFHTSSVAVHGVRLLMSLMSEYEKLREGASEKTTPSVDRSVMQTCSRISDNTTDIPVSDTDCAAEQLSLDAEGPLPFDDPTMWNFDIDSLGFEDLMDYLPSEGLLNNNAFNASMLSASGWPMW
jgi:transcription elongation factor SPT5